MVSSVTFRFLLCLILAATNASICPTLKSAANFTVIASSTVSNVGITIINGNLAISPSISMTGFTPPGVIKGITQLGNAIAQQAQKDVASAQIYLKAAPLTSLMTGMDLTGKTLGPGVYKFASTAAINTAGGILTLNGAGVYIFQVGSALLTADNSEIRVINGAKAGCVYWQVGSSATLGQNSRFVGNLLAYASVKCAKGIAFNGSIYAQTAAVSFIAATVTGQASCKAC